MAGINVTAFTKTMLEERRLDTCLYDAIVKHVKTGKLPQDKDTLVAAGFIAFNAIYGETWAGCTRAGVGHFMGGNEVTLSHAEKTPLMLCVWCNSQTITPFPIFR